MARINKALKKTTHPNTTMSSKAQVLAKNKVDPKPLPAKKASVVKHRPGTVTRREIQKCQQQVRLKYLLLNSI